MKHLSDEQIQMLADKIVSEDSFSRDDELAMLHIANCRECYSLLKCMMAVTEVVNHMDVIVSLPKQQQEEVVSASSCAIIKVVVLNVSAMLEQLQAEASEWVFDKPFALAGARSSQDKTSDVQTLEDIDNSESFVSYDPATRKLVIQIDGREMQKEPTAYLKYADGRKQHIVFEKREHIFWAEVHDLTDGEYELIIEK